MVRLLVASQPGMLEAQEFFLNVFPDKGGSVHPRCIQVHPEKNLMRSDEIMCMEEDLTKILAD